MQQEEVDPLSLPKDKVDGHLLRVAQNTRLKQTELGAPERRRGEGAGGSSEGDSLVQDKLPGIDATAVLSLNALRPVPGAEMHLKKVRSPDHFRTQYLSNLGIWTDNQAKQLTSAPRTEARYRRNVGSGGGGRGHDEIAREDKPPLRGPPRTPVPEAPTGGAGAGGAGAAGGGAAALVPLNHQRQGDGGEEQSTPAVLSEENARRDGVISERREEEGSAGRSGFTCSDRLRLPPPFPRPRAATTGGQEGVPDALAVVSRAVTGSAGGGQPGGGGGKASEEEAGAACQAGVAISAAVAAAAATTITNDVERERGVVVEVGGTCDVPGTEQGNGRALSSAAASGGCGVAAGGCSEVSASGLEKKGGSMSSPTVAEVARVEDPDAVAAGAEGTAELKAAVAWSTAAAEIAAAGSAGLSIEPSAAATQAAAAAVTATAAVAAAAAGGPATANTPQTPEGDDGTTVSSALCTVPLETRRHSISSDGRPPASETAAPPSSARSSDIGTRTMANPVIPGSPPLRAVKPPRRDIRKDYLTNLGMKQAVVAGPGGTRTPPPMIRRSSFIESVEHPVEEQLKDSSAGDITLEDVLRVVGSLLTGGGGKREIEPRPCPTCVKQKALRGSPPFGGRRDCEDGRNGRSGSGGRMRSKTDMDEEGGVAVPCGHRHVDFAPLVSAVYIPVHTEYSDRVRRSYWNSAGEIREMVYRNMIEFDAEDYNWEKVAEEEDMYFCEETGEFIHPIFFDSHEEAREVRANSTDGEGHIEYINEGRKMPVMQRR